MREKPSLVQKQSNVARYIQLVKIIEDEYINNSVNFTDINKPKNSLEVCRAITENFCFTTEDETDCPKNAKKFTKIMFEIGNEFYNDIKGTESFKYLINTYR